MELYEYRNFESNLSNSNIKNLVNSVFGNVRLNKVEISQNTDLDILADFDYDQRNLQLYIDNILSCSKEHAINNFLSQLEQEYIFIVELLLTLYHEKRHATQQYSDQLFEKIMKLCLQMYEINLKKVLEEDLPPEEIDDLIEILNEINYEHLEKYAKKAPQEKEADYYAYSKVEELLKPYQIMLPNIYDYIKWGMYNALTEGYDDNEFPLKNYFMSVKNYNLVPKYQTRQIIYSRNRLYIDRTILDISDFDTHDKMKVGLPVSKMEYQRVNRLLTSTKTYWRKEK